MTQPSFKLRPTIIGKSIRCKDIMEACGITHHTTFERARKRLGLFPNLALTITNNKRNVKKPQNIYARSDAEAFIEKYKNISEGKEEKILSIKELIELCHKFDADIKKLQTEVWHLKNESTPIKKFMEEKDQIEKLVSRSFSRTEAVRRDIMGEIDIVARKLSTAIEALKRFTGYHQED